MRSNRSTRFSNCFLFLVVGFLLLFSAFSAKAQSISTKCEWVWKWVWAWEYNGATKQTEYQYVYRYIYDCVPTVVETRPAMSSDGKSNSESPKKPAEPRTTPSKIGSSAKLKIGTYKIMAITERFGERITFKIKIESVGANGEVKARVYKDNDEGQLKGRVEANGQVRLEGFLIHVIRGLGSKSESSFKLKATVEDDTLINGSYREQYGSREFGGTFDKGILEEEF